MFHDFITAQYQIPKVTIRKSEPPEPEGFFNDPTNILLVAILAVVVIGVGVLIWRTHKRRPEK